MDDYTKKVKSVLGILMSVFVIIVLVHTVPLSKLLLYAKMWDLKLLLLSVVASLFSIIVRGLKWHIVLQLISKTPISSAIHSNNISLMLNAILPIRTGDIYKAYAVKHSDSFPGSLSAVFYDRLFDGIVIAGMFFTSFLVLRNSFTFNTNLLGLKISSHLITRSFDVFAFILFLGFTFLVLTNMRYPYRMIKRFLQLFSFDLCHRILRWTNNFITSSRRIAFSLRDPKYLLSLCGISVFAWSLYCLSIYLVAIGGPIGNLSIFQVMLISSMSIIVVQLPATPGGWGIFELGVIVAIVSTTNIPTAAAVPFAVIAHLTQYISVIIAGLCSKILILTKPEPMFFSLGDK